MAGFMDPVSHTCKPEAYRTRYLIHAWYSGTQQINYPPKKGPTWWSFKMIELNLPTMILGPSILLIRIVHSVFFTTLTNRWIHFITRPLSITNNISHPFYKPINPTIKTTGCMMHLMFCYCTHQEWTEINEWSWFQFRLRGWPSINMHVGVQCI